MMVRGKESLGMCSLLQRESDKEASEQQDFSPQEQPHANLGGIKLLFKSREMMLQPRIVFGVVFALLINYDG